MLFPVIQIEIPFKTLKNDEFIRTLTAIIAPNNIKHDMTRVKLSPLLPHILAVKEIRSSSFSCLQMFTTREQVYQAKTPTTQIWTV